MTMQLLRRTIAAVDAFQQRRAWLSLPVAVMCKASDDQGGSLAALIAYYGLLAVFPLLLVFAAVLGFVLSGHPGFKEHVLHTAESSFPSLAGYISNTVSGSKLALGVGLAAALWAGLGVTRATERAMNSVWYIPLHERPNLWWSRLRALGMLGILGATFLLSTALAGLRGIGGLFGVVTDVLAVAGALALNFALYALAFQVLTNRHLSWRSTVPGAVIGAVGWTALQNLGSYYVRHEVAHASQLYGSLAIVIGLLAWIYLGARLTLYAAELNAVLAYRLWPRSLSSGVVTEADRLAMARLAEQYRPPGRGAEGLPDGGAAEGRGAAEIEAGVAADHEGGG
jgi:membrane protein